MKQGSPLKQLTDASFESAVATGDTIAVIEFWAAWCMPCRMLEPVFREIDASFGSRVTVAQVDTDAHRETARKYEVGAVPTILILRGGEVTDRFVGLTSYETIASAIESAIDSTQAVASGGEHPEK